MMSDVNEWQEVVEDGTTYYVHEKYGNVMKLAGGAYLALAPKLLKFGPFPSPEEGQKVLEGIQEKLDQLVELLNLDLLKK